MNTITTEVTEQASVAGNPLDLYTAGAWFGTRLGHRLS
jgi:hypothetical protein